MKAIAPPQVRDKNQKILSPMNLSTFPPTKLFIRG